MLSKIWNKAIWRWFPISIYLSIYLSISSMIPVSLAILPQLSLQLLLLVKKKLKAAAPTCHWPWLNGSDLSLAHPCALAWLFYLGLSGNGGTIWGCSDLQGTITENPSHLYRNDGFSWEMMDVPAKKSRYVKIIKFMTPEGTCKLSMFQSRTSHILLFYTPERS